ncbi:MAG: hypothetical protein HFF26_09705, partial [Oscillospiraceae bacterium]|nr:hypothetical protein [Oscillospiraceae bacterium]
PIRPNLGLPSLSPKAIQFSTNAISASPTWPRTNNPGCMVQHCLPAHKGEEISAGVFEAHADEIFEEAENRLHAQKAVLYLLMKD